MNARMMAVIDCVTFPEDFTDADKEKFAAEVSADIGRFLPEGEIDDILDDLTATTKTVTVKFGKYITKAGKGEKMVFSFRLSVFLAVMNAKRLNKLTGYIFPVSLADKDLYWNNWKRAEKPVEKPVETPAN